MRLLRRLTALWRAPRAGADLDEEIEFHRAARQAQFERDGLGEDAARAASVRAMGNTTLAREDARALWIALAIESVWQDVAYGGRALARQPGFVLVAVATLASAIGLNTSLFTAFNAFMWQRWAVPHADRVVTIVNTRTQADFALEEYRYFAGHARSFSGIVAARCISGLGDGCVLKLNDADITAAFVTGNYFQVLGVAMQRGRAFGPAEDRRDDPRAVAVLSAEAWHSRFGDEPSVDPVTYLAAAIIFAGACAAATFVPARRAARVDPAVALRCD